MIEIVLGRIVHVGFVESHTKVTMIQAKPA